jgi:hypothetical protein
MLSKVGGIKLKTGGITSKFGGKEEPAPRKRVEKGII